ncbi:MAG: phosphate/phosphite/phosphonate ABC transporter substrate-binding protein [Pseudomonadota bacterium]
MTPTLTRRGLLTVGLGALLVAGAAPLLAQEERLRLAFIPQENPEKLLGDVDAITTWLSQDIGVPVEGFVTIDHAAAVEALRNGDADISFMGALPFVLAEAEIGAVPLLSEVYRGAPQYTGRVFVRRDSGITSLADLAGQDIAFADPISESGYLYPLAEFERAGLISGVEDADSFFGRVYFAGGYQQAMQAMAQGLVAAAGASQYADLLLTPQQQSQVTWIAESPAIPSHVVIARPGLDDRLKERFVEAMMQLNEPEHRDKLQYVYGPDGYLRADAAAFDGVREIARKYGLLS